MKILLLLFIGAILFSCGDNERLIIENNEVIREVLLKETNIRCTSKNGLREDCYLNLPFNAEIYKITIINNYSDVECSVNGEVYHDDTHVYSLYDCDVRVKVYYKLY